MTVRIETAGAAQAAEERAAEPAYREVQYGHADFNQAAPSAAEGGDTEAIALALQQAPQADDSAQQPFRRFGRKVGRNDPCPCGSGRKFKACHGRLS